jgi:hypothetical protein
MITMARGRLFQSQRRRAGQSIVEMAVTIPVLFFLLMGGFDASLMIVNKMTAGYAVRQGVRLAAELGGSQTNPNATTSQIDIQIVRNVLAVTRSMNSAVVTEIDIYAPTRSDGSYQAGDLIDQYYIGGGTTVTAGAQTFPLQNRLQTPPNETSIGIRLVWDYNAPAGVFPKQTQLVDYAVMKAAPVLT